MENYKSHNFPWQDFFPDNSLTFPWLLVKSLTFPWHLYNSLTFPGFPDKWSPCTESRTCVVTWTQSTFGDRTFAAAVIGLRNSLPPYLSFKVINLQPNPTSISNFLLVTAVLSRTISELGLQSVSTCYISWQQRETVIHHSRWPRHQLSWHKLW